MGNQGGVNLGIVGADWGPNGGGATILGVRVGGSGDRGFEFGVNPGIGVHVNGEGLYAGARADVGIRDGISVGSEARAVAAGRQAHADASAAAHASGAWATASAEDYINCYRWAAPTIRNVKTTRLDFDKAMMEVDTWQQQGHLVERKLVEPLFVSQVTPEALEFFKVTYEDGEVLQADANFASDPAIKNYLKEVQYVTTFYTGVRVTAFRVVIHKRRSTASMFCCTHAWDIQNPWGFLDTQHIKRVEVAKCLQRSKNEAIKSVKNSCRAELGL